MELLEADYARGGLLAAADDAREEVRKLGAHELHELAAVVYYDVGADGEDGLELLFIFLGASAVGGVHLDASGGQGRGDVVLRGEGVRARDIHLRAACGKHAAEVGRLGLQVDGEGDLHAREGLFGRKIRLDAAQNCHVPAHPGDLQLPGRGQANVSDIIHVEGPPASHIYN